MFSKTPVMECLSLLAGAAEEYFHHGSSLASPSTINTSATSQTGQAFKKFVDALTERRLSLQEHHSLSPDSGDLGPAPSNAILDSLIRVFVPSAATIGPPPNASWPLLQPDESAAFLVACVVIERKRDGAPRTTLTTRSFLYNLRDAYGRAHFDTTGTSISPNQDDPQLPFKGLTPPTNVDFERQILRPPLGALLQHEIVDIDLIWLGVGPHDGYPLCHSIEEYGKIRQFHPTSNWRQNPLIWQSALTYGLLEAIMDVKIPESFLVRYRDNGHMVASGMHLSMLLFDWQVRLAFTKLTDDTVHRRWITQADRVLDEARAILNDESTNHHLVRAGFWRTEVDRLLCAIATLIEAISHGMDPTAQAISASSSAYIHDARFVSQVKLESAGWCRFVVGALTSSISVMNYATSLRPFVRTDPAEHSRCSATHCTIHNINSETYVAQHATPGCTCAYVKPPLERIMELLANSEVPVLVRGVDGTLSVRSASEGPYVAISHVWVDGLGSSTELGLPGCQVTRLASLATQLVPDGAFWQDGLCVPANRPMRKRAIRLMAKTYEDATKVAVLDAGVRTLSSVTTPLEESLLRIATSGWMQRIWTLQEGLLARELYFEFADGLVRMEDLKRSSMAAVHPWFLPSHPVVSALLSALIFERGDKPARGRTFPELLRLLHHRTTSKPEDETLAIAGLVGVDAGDLASLDTAEERMALFLCRIGRVPRGIVCFGGPAQKMRKPSFRWAPLTLTTTPFVSMECDGVCTQEGLTGEFSIFRFPEMDLPEPYGSKAFVSNQETGLLYEILPFFSSGGGGSQRFNAVLFIDRHLPDRLSSTQCAAVLVEEGRRTDTANELVCTYVNGTALFGHKDSLEEVLPLLEPLKQTYTVVEGRLLRNLVLIT